MLYHLSVFCGGIPVSISAVKHEKQFYYAVSKVIHETLAGAFFTFTIRSDGIVIDSCNISEKFLGTTIPFFYGNRKLELRVYPETLS